MTAHAPDGTPLGLGPNQQRALLAVLLLRRGRPAPMADLLGALWGERPPPRAVGTLRTYVSRLRTLFEPERPSRAPARLLVSASDGYALRLHEPFLDIAEFERGIAEAARLRTAGATGDAYRTLGEALGLWAGTPLAGLPGPHAETQRDRLTEMWLTAREDHFHGALELGLDRDTAAVADLRAFAAEHPLRERAQALLMLALHRAGRSGEALAVYGATCDTLSRELGTGPGPELTALHRRLTTRAAPAPAATPPREAARPAAPSGAGARGDAQACGCGPGLPAPDGPDGPDAPAVPYGADRPAAGPGSADGCFAGRAAELALLGEVLAGTGSGVPVAVLTGMPGIGKTALADRAAALSRHRFPDGVLRADLGAGSARALAGLLGTLGVPEPALPGGIEARAALYRSLLAGRRVLVLLDDAPDTAGLLPLLPAAPGCAALVTAPGRGLVVPGARLVDVPELDDDTALLVLAAAAGERRVRAEPDAVRDLVRQCAGLPLALHLAGTRLRQEPALTAAALASPDGAGLTARLRAGGRSVEDAFRRRCATLAPAALRMLRATVAAPDGFGPAAAAALLEDGGPPGAAPAAAAVPEAGAAEAADLLEAIVDAGLLRPAASGRYRYHPLVRAYARHRLAPA
ncbi:MULTISPECIES: AfsR/SARP family transcriptional regulator [Streptomyces]|uniref:AfsR/SARP family transcriptional regulator n=1 Tax=Streptomyces TaxID=1883 RepID=UPI002F941C41